MQKIETIWKFSNNFVNWHFLIFYLFLDVLLLQGSSGMHRPSSVRPNQELHTTHSRGKTAHWHGSFQATHALNNFPLPLLYFSLKSSHVPALAKSAISAVLPVLFEPSTTCLGFRRSSSTRNESTVPSRLFCNVNHLEVTLLLLWSGELSAELTHGTTAYSTIELIVRK